MSFRFRSKDCQPAREDAPLSNAGCERPSISFPLKDLETLSDEDLVAQLVAGTHDALTVLFERYCDMVFSIARRALKDNGEAEETLQQVFLDIYKAANQFDREKASFKTWLLQFAYHRSINRKKHLSAKGFYASEELVEQLLPVELYQGGGRTLQLCSPECRHLIEQLLKTIQPRQRMAIEMTFFDGLTAEEIARQTGETPAVVRHNLYRGLSKLRIALLENEQVRKTTKAKDAIEGVSFAFTRPL
jgi:RNA polymerase sigma-70 factor (ECF subfamily)